MVAAAKVMTETGRTKFGKYELVTGTVTIVTTKDWVDIAGSHSLGNAVFVKAHTAATGVDAEPYFNNSGSPGLIFFTQTGAAQVCVVAGSQESTGGD